VESNVYVGADAEIELGYEGFNNTATWIADGNKVTITDRDGFEMKLEITLGAPAGDAALTVLDAGPMILQIGANEGQTVDISIPEVSPVTLGTDNIKVYTDRGAAEAISSLDKAINMVSSIRAKLGAYENRLTHAIANLNVTSENMTESLSRIEDVDMAEEMTNYTQRNVLSQAGVSMLSQANERPQQILSLLQ